MTDTQHASDCPPFWNEPVYRTARNASYHILSRLVPALPLAGGRYLRATLSRSAQQILRLVTLGLTSSADGVHPSKPLARAIDHCHDLILTLTLCVELYPDAGDGVYEPLILTYRELVKALRQLNASSPSHVAGRYGAAGDHAPSRA